LFSFFFLHEKIKDTIPTNMISTTRAGLTQLVRISRQQKVSKILFSVRGGGCNGFQYHLEPMTDAPQPSDEVVPLHNGLDLVVDSHSIFHLIGTEIDWKDDNIMGSRFDFNNPNAMAKCGCGSTFSMKQGD
jgi:iron-sulfur cluster assembly accessory protein